VNRRETLKAFIAAPVVASAPWYSEQPAKTVQRQCQHQFDGVWRHWEDASGGGGGEAVCSLCGMGAMQLQWTLVGDWAGLY
jgi:hypothetical protein